MRKAVDENIASIGMHIKKARQRSDLTQEQLAELVEVTPQYLSDLERGVVGTSIATLMKLCRKLNVTSDYLLFGTGTDRNSDMVVLVERLQYMPKYKADLIEKGLNLLLDAIEVEPESRE